MHFARFIPHFALCIAFLTGCDPLTRHKALTTIFDGVPSMPSAEEYCQDYHERAKAAELVAAARKEGDKKADGQGSTRHLPYEEKRCNDCHDQQKGGAGGLILPARELCFSCHTDFIKGPYVHGPVAVGDCLACHLPHTSSFGYLLARNKGEICARCHQEKRLAAEMHDQFAAKMMACADCHNPHFGNARYFFK
ncbi:MAG: cytochrome C [Geobacteraceae bacterium]|nr:cytochrome C [Geobacteraceae bacterium]